MKQVDWIRFCRDYRIRTGDKLRNGEWLPVVCPFCHDHELHGGINIKKNSYHCWHGCEGNLFDFVAAMVGCSTEPREIYKILGNYIDDLSSVYHISSTCVETNSIVEVKHDRKMPGRNPLGTGCKKYLEKRGFNATYMEHKYRLKDGGIGGPWAFRLMIPVIEDGNIVCWQGRSINPKEKIRYKSSSLTEAVNIKTTLYNLDNCKGDTVILCEGVFDTWKIGDGCCCLFGISVKDIQLALLAERYKHIYVLFDPEKDAQRSAMECVRKLQNLGVHVENIYMESDVSSDPGDMTKKEVLQIRRELLNDYSEETPWLL